jgi:hypothetical protein
MDRNIVVTESQLHWMFRYCLSRSSYAVADGIDAIVFNWKSLSDNTKQMIAKEIEDHLRKNDSSRFDCDANSWAQLLERIKDEP